MNGISKDKDHSVKMPHMFQKTYSNIENDFLEVHQDNLSKILRSYRHNESTDNQNSLIEYLKKLMYIDTFDESVNDYLETLKVKYLHIEEKEEVLETPNELTPIEEIEVSNNKEEILDISDIFKSSEQEIINTKDQKSLLKDLIADINLNSKTNNQYDDLQFQKNIEDIINETRKEDVEQQVLNTDIGENNKKRKKNRNFYPYFLIITIIILLGVLGYVYLDLIIELFNRFFK